MKIEFTADINLKAERESPERYNALKQILIELKENNISYLIIDGDTFNKEINKDEKKIYMPISNKIINEFKPLKIFLRHIHKSCKYKKIIFPDSSQSININETAKRRFIIYDTFSNDFFSKQIQNQIIYLTMEEHIKSLFVKIQNILLKKMSIHFFICNIFLSVVYF
ncbi:MAG TPA: hypothetical protein PLD27_03135 [bacterium]|nr:hypothetical protein [bacterium]HOL47331.1 hypothetical protein [bacterium]HPQ17963.1 hypothetical protein [bacterium]